MSAMTRSAAASFVIALAMTGGACKPSAAASRDAGPGARAPIDAGVTDGGVTTTSTASDGGATDEGALPAETSDELTLRARHLFEAIVQDNPDLGSDLLFPRDACAAARDATDPLKVWDTKLSSSFRHGVHSLHKRTKGIERALFVSFEIGRTVTQEAPRKHEWKEPLWVVHHARIDFTLDGRDLHFDIAELTSWRGAWYVTRLRGGA
jgi:hypothetical protein